MASQPRSQQDAPARLRAAEDALRKVQAQAAALEELSEQLSLAVHVLEAEIGGLTEQVRADAELRTEAELRAQAAAAYATDSPADEPEARIEPPARARSADTEGARLVALNMALEGQPRETTERYLDEHFDIPNRERLLDDVYAAARR